MMKVKNVSCDGISEDMFNTVVRQLGAISIKTTPADINIATFQLSENIKIKYKYELKERDLFYLERVQPYPMMIGVTDNTDDLLVMLRKDLKMFKNAFNSSNFPEFLAIMTKMTEAIHRVEDMFLHYNAKPEDLTEIDQDLLHIYHTLSDAKRNATAIQEPADLKVPADDELDDNADPKPADAFDGSDK